jgi:hypothetical protein
MRGGEMGDKTQQTTKLPKISELDLKLKSLRSASLTNQDVFLTTTKVDRKVVDVPEVILYGVDSQ